MTAKLPVGLIASLLFLFRKPLVLWDLYRRAKPFRRGMVLGMRGEEMLRILDSHPEWSMVVFGREDGGGQAQVENHDGHLHFHGTHLSKLSEAPILEELKRCQYIWVLYRSGTAYGTIELNVNSEHCISAIKPFRARQEC